MAAVSVADRGGPKETWSTTAGALRMDYANNLDIVDSNFEGNGYGIRVGGGGPSASQATISRARLGQG